MGIFRKRFIRKKNKWVATKSTSSSFTFTLDGGSYTLTGAGLSFVGHYILTLGSNSYSSVGSSIGFTSHYRTNLASGSYSLNGTSLTFTSHYRFVLSEGSYSATGSNLSFVGHYQFTLGNDSYSTTGSNLNFVGHYRIYLENDAVALTGNSLGITLQGEFFLHNGSYSITGAVATFKGLYRFTLESGECLSTGSSLQFTYQPITPIEPEPIHVGPTHSLGGGTSGGWIDYKTLDRIFGKRKPKKLDLTKYFEKQKLERFLPKPKKRYQFHLEPGTILSQGTPIQWKAVFKWNCGFGIYYTQPKGLKLKTKTIQRIYHLTETLDPLVTGTFTQNELIHVDKKNLPVLLSFQEYLKSQS